MDNLMIVTQKFSTESAHFKVFFDFFADGSEVLSHHFLGIKDSGRIFRFTLLHEKPVRTQSFRERCLPAFENKLNYELLYLEPVGGSILLAIANHLKNKSYGY